MQELTPVSGLHGAISKEGFKAGYKYAEPASKMTLNDPRSEGHVMSVPILPETGHEPMPVLPAELYPSIEHLVIDDGAPVDGIYSEKQMRLLTRPLYSSWPGPHGDSNYIALANVGMFFAANQPPLVPDVLLSLGVRLGTDFSKKENLSYFCWLHGKHPDVVIEIVSNKVGGELGPKKDQYGQIGIPIYVVWDPSTLLSGTRLQVFGLDIRRYKPIRPDWFEDVGLGLQIWHGTFEQSEHDWLRWCDREGRLIPLGEERAGEAHQRADQEQQRADQEQQRAERAEERLARLEAQLRQSGIEPANGSKPS